MKQQTCHVSKGTKKMAKRSDIERPLKTSSENALELFKTLELYIIFIICHFHPVENITEHHSNILDSFQSHLYHYTRTCNNELEGSF